MVRKKVFTQTLRNVEGYHDAMGLFKKKKFKSLHMSVYNLSVRELDVL